ncbi:hypothetical protein BDW22DRAFT_1470267 [Trametopsis cervina]|nr:hypothetical protein BDW22DRAFT_1470267 [Trametopsis cervina]
MKEGAHTTYRRLLTLDAAPDGRAGCTRCGECPEALYRCSECFRRDPYCNVCIVREHTANPLHRVEEWTDACGYWRSSNLQSLGMVINLGHGMKRCHKSFREPRNVCVVTNRGVQDVFISFCECAEDGKLVQLETEQLLGAGLWPGSWKQPRTAFALHVLDDFQLLSTQGTITAQDYLTCLERKTDAVLPGEVKHRYRELLFAIRQYQFIKLCRRKGVLPSRTLEYGSLATLCPACPHIDVNISPEWQTREEDKLHLDALYHAIDGNFTQNLKDKGADAADMPLTLGAGYFANEEDSTKYFGAMPQEKYKSSSCNKFGAMGYSGHWGSVSGLVGLSCARHMFVLPGGTVDLKVGESFDAVDLCMLSGLRKWLALRLHISAYDINCQYRVKFWERIAKIQKMITTKRLPVLRTVTEFTFPATRYTVGKFHEAAHKVACRLLNSFHYLPGAAQTDGEALERVWSHVTGLALRTREMTAGHRHDTINLFHDDMNWRKTSSFLARKRVDAGRQYQESSESQAQFTADLAASELHEGELERWREEMGKWAKMLIGRGQPGAAKDGKEGQSPYEAIGNKSAWNYGTLLCTSSYVKVMTLGRARLLLQLSRLTEEKVATLRGELVGRLETWTKAAATTLTPVIALALSKLSDGRKEEIESVRVKPRQPSKAARNFSSELREYSIHLPSSYPPDVRECAALKECALVENALRKVQADAALDDVRSNLAASYGLHQRLAKATTQQLKQRAKGPAERVHKSVTNAANVYRRARAAMLHLGMAADDPTYRPLKKGHLKSLVIRESDRKYGDSRKPQHSWIWGSFSFIENKEGLSEAVRSMMIESTVTLRVHWCRGQAKVDRWREEMELIDEEMKRSIWFFDYQVVLWEARVTARLNESAGAAEYARK